MNDPQCDEKLYERRMNEDNEEYEIFHGNECDINNYEKLEIAFMNDNLPESHEVSELINKIVDAMRKDLGNSKIRW